MKRRIGLLAIILCVMGMAASTEHEGRQNFTGHPVADTPKPAPREPGPELETFESEVDNPELRAELQSALRELVGAPSPVEAATLGIVYGTVGEIN